MTKNSDTREDDYFLKGFLCVLASLRAKNKHMKKFLVILFVLPLCVAAQQKEMSLEDAVVGMYTYLRPQAISQLQWQDDASFSYVSKDTLWLEAAEKGSKKVLFSLEGLKSALSGEFKRFPAYSWHDSQNLVFMSANKYYIYDLKSFRLTDKIDLGEEAENADFCKASRKAAYTLGDDVYISGVSGEVIRVTADGGSGIVNGKAVHRNEFGIESGLFWSPGGNFLAFYRMDESMVKDYPLVDFMAREAEYTPVKYPMAGMESHHVKIGIYNLKTAKTIFLQTGEPLDHYLTNICWSPDEKSVFVAEINRGQYHLQMNQYDVSTGERIKTLFEETDAEYVEPMRPMRFSKANPQEFYWFSRRDGWLHLYKYDCSGALKKQITQGQWEVTNLLGSDTKEKYLFVEATKESPLESHIYLLNAETGEMEKLTSEPGIHSGVLSPGGNYLADNFESSDTPPKTDLINTKGKKLRNLFTPADPLAGYNLGENKIVEIQSADRKTTLYGRLILPTGFNPDKKYPVVVYVYGGPHSQMVDKSWHNQAGWWQYYLASKGYIAFTLDNRGTINRGADFEQCIHRELGVNETADQMQGIEYLKSLPYVDSGRIGVHGWSYGGFMTLNLKLHYPDVFKVAVAGGPVVDWSLYEIMYGERYMDKPQENPEGYGNANMLNLVGNLGGKLMLIHGLQDETVVMQNSIKFLNECIKQGKQVDFFVYPTHPHNVRGKDRLHLMQKVSDYFFDNL